MAFDLTKSHFQLQLQKEVATGATVDREGILLASALESGVEKVSVAGAAGSLQVVGFAVSDNEDIATTVARETVTIPNTGAADEVVQLSNTNIVGSGATVEVMVKRNDNGTVMTAQATVGAVDATNEFFVDPAAGTVTFDTADAGVSVDIQYRYNLTVLESRLRFFERNVNNQAGAIFNEVSVAMKGEIETYEYDASVDWSGSVTPTTGAGGLLTDGGGGTDVSAKVVVIKVPSADSPTLGLRFDFTV